MPAEKISSKKADFLTELSSRLRIPFRFAKLPKTCRAYLLDGATVLNEELTREQAHWSYCHEVAHHILNHNNDLPRNDTEEREQEAEANRLAAEILLPESDFKPYVQESLLRLKEIFPFASHEVLARRRLCYRFGLLTIIDNDRLTCRISPDDWNVPPSLFPLEKDALKKCLENKGGVNLEQEGFRVEASYLDEGRGVVRVILFLEGKE